MQITVAEDIGVEGRGKLYEETGTRATSCRTTLLQLSAITAMEPPIVFDADACATRR